MGGAGPPHIEGKIMELKLWSVYFLLMTAIYFLAHVMFAPRGKAWNTLLMSTAVSAAVCVGVFL